MLNQLQRLFKHSAIYGVAETVSRGTGFVLLFFYVRVLSESDLGVRSAVYVAAAFLGLAYTLGLDNAFLRYFMDKELADKKVEIFSTVFYVSALVGILFLIAVFFFDESFSQLITDSSSFEYITRLLFLIIIFDTAVIYPTLILRAENRLMYYSLVACARFFLFIIVNIILVFGLNRGLRGVFEANLIVVITVVFLLLPVYRKYLHVRFSLPLLKRMLAFGIPTIFTLLCMRVIDLSDRQIILRFIGESELGRYSVAYTLGMVGVMVFINSFRLVWQPFFLSQKDNPDARNLFSRVATYYAMFIGMAFLGITLFRKEIFVIYAPKFSISLAEIVPFVSCAYVFFGFYVIMLAGIFIREKTRFLPIATVTGAALNLGLNFVFIPVFGIIGAAYSTVIAYVVMVIIMYGILHNVYRVNYEFKRLGMVLILTVVPIGVTVIFQPEVKLVSIFFRSALFLIPPSVYLISDFLLPEERCRLKQFFNIRLNSG